MSNTGIILDGISSLGDDLINRSMSKINKMKEIAKRHAPSDEELHEAIIDYTMPNRKKPINSKNKKSSKYYKKKLKTNKIAKKSRKKNRKK